MRGRCSERRAEPSARRLIDMAETVAPKTCLVTGATGYIGGRLVPELLAAGHPVRVMTRSPDRLRDHPWSGRVEIVRADAGQAAEVAAACAGADVVYYLIHAIGSGPEFEETDRRPAHVMTTAVREAGVGRLVYLGGLEPAGEELSPHLRSRAEVARILLDSGAPTVVLRAAVVLGSGSASFAMLRYLPERLPVMVTPRWVHSLIQPIAIRDVLRYLVGCGGLPSSVHRGFDVGGPDRMNYAEMMQRYAEVAGLPRRRILPVPLFTPSLSSHWVGLITPVPASIARPLVESLRNTVVCREHDIAEYVPDPPEGVLGFDDAVRLAIQRVMDSAVATRWSSASVYGAPSDPLPTDPDWAGGSLYVDERTRDTSAPATRLWRVVEGIGGERGWYSFALAWRGRGALDRLAGDGGTRTACTWVTRSTSGGWRPARRAGSCACGRRCGCPASPGWSSTWNTGTPRRPRAAPGCGSAPPSPLVGCWATSTGGPSPRSTASSSAGWRATSCAPRSSRPGERRSVAGGQRAHDGGEQPGVVLDQLRPVPVRADGGHMPGGRPELVAVVGTQEQPLERGVLRQPAHLRAVLPGEQCPTRVEELVAAGDRHQAADAVPPEPRRREPERRDRAEHGHRRDRPLRHHVPAGGVDDVEGDDLQRPVPPTHHPAGTVVLGGAHRFRGDQVTEDGVLRSVAV